MALTSMIFKHRSAQSNYDNLVDYSTICGIWILLLFLLSKSISIWRRRQKQVDHGCCAPVPLPGVNKATLGISKIQTAASHLQRQSYLELSEQRFKDAGSMTYSSNMFGKTSIDTCDPRNIQTILSLKFRDFQLGPDRRRAFSPLLGSGFFAADGAEWHSSRTAVRPTFTGDLLTNVGNFENHFQRMLHVIKQSGAAFDLSRLFFAFTLDLATETFLGKSYDSLLDEQSRDDGEETRSSTFAAAFNRAQRVMADNSVMGRLGPIFAGKEGRKQFQHDCDTVLGFVEEAVNEVKAQTEAQQGETERFVFLNDLLKKGYGAGEVKYEVVNILVAGRDTTASLLSGLWFELARHPGVYQKMRDEVMEKVSDIVPSVKDLTDMPYLHACVSEALRLYPPVPINVRQAVRDTILPTGGGVSGEEPVLVTEGTRVGFNTWAMHRNEGIWGSDAGSFRPERWLNTDRSKVSTGWEFIPFSGGPRICLGQKLALTEARFVTCRLAQHFTTIQAESARTPRASQTPTPQSKTPQSTTPRSSIDSERPELETISGDEESPACTWKWKENLGLTVTSADSTWVSMAE